MLTGYRKHPKNPVRASLKCWAVVALVQPWGSERRAMMNMDGILMSTRPLVKVNPPRFLISAGSADEARFTKMACNIRIMFETDNKRCTRRSFLETRLSRILSRYWLAYVAAAGKGEDDNDYFNYTLRVCLCVWVCARACVHACACMRV